MRIPASERRLRSGASIQLRSPDAAESAAVLVYIRQLAREASRNLNHPPSFFEAMTEEAERAFLASSNEHPQNFFLAAFLGDEVIGTTSLVRRPATFSPHCAELGLGVLGAHRRQGVGRLLMEALIENAERVGIWNLVLHVRTFNEPAIALYESLGFRRVGVLHRMADLPEGFADEYVYQRDGQRAQG